MRLLKNHNRSSLVYSSKAVNAISGKWKLLIIMAIGAGNKRFKDIEREVKNISPKMLSQELKQLADLKLIKRSVYSAQPVIIEYTLTLKAKKFDRMIAELCKIEWD